MVQVAGTTLALGHTLVYTRVLISFYWCLICREMTRKWSTMGRFTLRDKELLIAKTGSLIDTNNRWLMFESDRDHFRLLSSWPSSWIKGISSSSRCFSFTTGRISKLCLAFCHYIVRLSLQPHISIWLLIFFFIPQALLSGAALKNMRMRHSRLATYKRMKDVVFALDEISPLESWNLNALCYTVITIIFPEHSSQSW